MRVLFVGDIVGQPGRRAFHQLGRDLARANRADFVIVNCENAAGGFGVTPEVADELLSQGAHCLTSGNHIWKHRAIYSYIEKEDRLLRPANFPEGTPGHGLGVYTTGAHTFAVVNLLGTISLEPLECPFRTFDRIYEGARHLTALLFVDFHGECTSEKAAFAHYVDGRASVVVGTHTHVQTADERILPKGTAFITDAGMTGPEDSVIGIDKRIILERFLRRMPQRFEVAAGPAMLCGALIELDPKSGRAVSIRRIQERAA
jgi:2',3'-cyclic-nucleotide 2'-phosphodiesterase